jgi:hypothetical protein
MEEFRKLEKSDLHDIICVAKASYDIVSYESYVLPDIISCFDSNQIYKINLYGYFRAGKLVHFAGYAKSLSIGSSYELRLATTLPEFRRMGYLKKSLDRRLGIIEELVRDGSGIIQVTSKNPKLYLEHGFIESGYVTRKGFIYLYKILG